MAKRWLHSLDRGIRNALLLGGNAPVFQDCYKLSGEVSCIIVAHAEIASDFERDVRVGFGPSKIQSSGKMLDAAADALRCACRMNFAGAP